MTIQQKSFCSFHLKFKNIDVVVNPTEKVKDAIAIYSLDQSPYLKSLETDDLELLINSAGEYEAKDVFVVGKKVKGENTTVYTISGEDINIGVISFLNNPTSVPVEFFESADIILIGAGGGMLFTAKDAEELIQKLSPKVCIVHGFKEQAPKELQNTLDATEEAAKLITGMKEMTEKSYKLTRDDLDRIEDNTETYYFNL